MNDYQSAVADPSAPEKVCGCGPDCTCGPDCRCTENGACAPACTCAD